MSLGLISKSDFIGFYNIEFDSVSDALFTTYADQLDELIITRLFGKDMYDDIVDNPETTENAYLIDNFLKSMQKGYFYYYFNRDRESFSTSLGEFEADAENATKAGVSRDMKLTAQYNIGVELYNKANEYVVENETDYPEYETSEYVEDSVINFLGI